MFKYTENKRGSVGSERPQTLKGITETYLFWRPLMGATLLSPPVWILNPRPL
jgi:hypothetical protein